MRRWPALPVLGPSQRGNGGQGGAGEQKCDAPPVEMREGADPQ